MTQNPLRKGWVFCCPYTPQPARPCPHTTHSPRWEPDSPEGEEKPSGLPTQNPDTQGKNQKNHQKTRVSTRESTKKLGKNLTFGKLLLYCSTFCRKTRFSSALARFFARSLPLRRSFLGCEPVSPAQIKVPTGLSRRNSRYQFSATKKTAC